MGIYHIEPTNVPKTFGWRESKAALAISDRSTLGPFSGRGASHLSSSSAKLLCVRKFAILLLTLVLATTSAAFCTPARASGRIDGRRPPSEAPLRSGCGQSRAVLHQEHLHFSMVPHPDYPHCFPAYLKASLRQSLSIRVLAVAGEPAEALPFSLLCCLRI